MSYLKNVSALVIDKDNSPHSQMSAIINNDAPVIDALLNEPHICKYPPQKCSFQKDISVKEAIHLVLIDISSALINLDSIAVSHFSDPRYQIADQLNILTAHVIPLEDILNKIATTALALIGTDSSFSCFPESLKRTVAPKSVVFNDCTQITQLDTIYTNLSISPADSLYYEVTPTTCVKISTCQQAENNFLNANSSELCIRKPKQNLELSAEQNRLQRLLILDNLDEPAPAAVERPLTNNLRELATSRWHAGNTISHKLLLISSGDYLIWTAINLMPGLLENRYDKGYCNLMQTKLYLHILCRLDLLLPKDTLSLTEHKHNFDYSLLNSYEWLDYFFTADIPDLWPLIRVVCFTYEEAIHYHLQLLNVRRDKEKDTKLAELALKWSISLNLELNLVSICLILSMIRAVANIYNNRLQAYSQMVVFNKTIGLSNTGQSVKQWYWQVPIEYINNQVQSRYAQAYLWVEPILPIQNSILSQQLPAIAYSTY